MRVNLFISRDYNLRPRSGSRCYRISGFSRFTGWYILRILEILKSCQAFVLAGGASRRMGTDKSQLRLEQQTFAERISETLLKVTDSVTIVGHQYSNLPSVADIYPQWGALGGLHAALTACQREWAIVAACDLPFVTPELFQQLAALRLDHEAVVPLQPDGRAQPLAALYRIDPCRQRATGLIEAGRRRPLDLLEAVNTRWVQFAEIRNLHQSEKFFVNINTPEDYYEATGHSL
ncbi:MAG TPA: molybdenum cofactor guanylyltransferase [Pyrinomonadaceae bacterium]|nr:molybdenum cofactor guanylyltransferase [Pyrinomonadaceae bacterium]